MKKIMGCGLLLTLSLWGGIASAGIIVGGTRVVYDGSKREASLSVNNPDKIPYLIQSWVDANGPKGDNKAASSPPFVVTPPLFRLEANSENLLRIIRTGGNLPEDRESVFWMDVKSIPASTITDKNVLQIAIKTRIKLFYRPAKLGIRPEDTYKSVAFHRQGNQLQVNNPSPYFISFSSLKVGNAVIDTTNVMVPPKASATYTLPASASGNQVTWQAINDFGGSSLVVKTPLQ